MGRLPKKVAEEIDIKEVQKERLILAGLTLSDEALEFYFSQTEDRGLYREGEAVPLGYKKCGKCGHVLKYHLFNKNSGSKTCTTGNCKECQKAAASKSYGKTKKSRSYKKYYEENKEKKLEHAKKYYANNKEKLNAQHKLYLSTDKGKAVMKNARIKRDTALKNNEGIPYTKDLIIQRDRDFLGLEHPVCLLCNQPITDLSGTACHMDHIIGVYVGGANCFSNVHLVHKSCNLVKTKDARDLEGEIVDIIKKRTKEFMDAKPELFESK